MQKIDSRKLLAWIIIATSAILWLLIAIPLFAGKVYVIGDLWNQYIPIRYFYAKCLAHGDNPLWFPGIFGGYYLHGAGQVGMMHPLHLAMYKWLPFQVAFDSEILLTYPFMFVGMYLFLRRWSLRTDSSLFGALLFTFSTYNLLRIIHPDALEIIAQFPWVLYCTDLIIRGRTWRTALRAAAGFGLLNASELWMGYPQYVWFSALAIGAYTLLLLVMRTVRVSRLALLVGAGMVGILGGAVQLLPTADSLALSVRALSPDWDKWGESTAGSTDPRYLTQVVSPFTLDVSHKQRLYFGAVPLLLAIWGFARRRRFAEARLLIIASAISAGLCVWLCTGHFGGLYYIQSSLPFVGNFRYPSRYVHLLGLATAILGAFAFEDLVDSRQASPSERSKFRSIALLCVPLILCIATTAFTFASKTQQVTTAPLHVLSGVAIMALATAAMIAVVRNRSANWSIVALIVLTALDVGYYGLPYSVFGKIDSLDRRLADIPVPGDDQSHRIMGGHELGDFDAITMAGWNRLDGFEGLPPYKRLDYRVLQARRVGGVKWLYRSSVDLHGFAGNYAIYDADDVTGLKPSSKENWFEVPRPLDRVRCVTHTVVAPQSVNTAIKQIDVETTAIVDSEVKLTAGPVGKAELLDDAPGRIRVRVRCDQPQLLVTTESFHPGWHIRIDGGASQSCLPVNGDFLGCLAPNGDHELLFVFEPKSFRNGAWASGIGLLLIVLTFVGSMMVRNHPAEDTAARFVA